MTASKRESYLRFGNGHAFEPAPRFFNHMCHWAPWAEHYRDHDIPAGMLANMLGCALEEIDRLCKRGLRYRVAHAALLFAFIELVETGEAKQFVNDDMTLPDALGSVQLLHKWRRENKLNIQAVDVS